MNELIIKHSRKGIGWVIGIIFMQTVLLSTRLMTSGVFAQWHFWILLCVWIGVLVYFAFQFSPKKTIFYADGKIQKNQLTEHIDHFSGIAIAYAARGGYEIALVPKNKLGQALTVYIDHQMLWNKNQATPPKLFEIQKQIADFTGLKAYGMIGCLIADEWYYLANNPQSPDLYGQYWKR